MHNVKLECAIYQYSYQNRRNFGTDLKKCTQKSVKYFYLTQYPPRVYQHSWLESASTVCNFLQNAKTERLFDQVRGCLTRLTTEKSENMTVGVFHISQKFSSCDHFCEHSKLFMFHVKHFQHKSCSLPLRSHSAQNLRTGEPTGIHTQLRAQAN